MTLPPEGIFLDLKVCFETFPMCDYSDLTLFRVFRAYSGYKVVPAASSWITRK
ncbi:hypothetical protein SERLA73DRAFT_191819 [Serpula lacrymans var. lacrymans S7.3]|uniref:Uncharacterized protein n=2 Tax=Serpula lacrymans var. lacrymans TaxID=341189 RepID=F8QIE2_SERL3|nr:uncharacterized protein SERLADRAFT_467783 [Serpula lacrymans var. lacrymans S7.9]EGN91909.1 hypothetical protein SERLA73DRAFT_191819 [Serpula lacrymans var. lacrymans S7.3]EGO24449.1 hypothetical protein SERLADRAFT_467783 [Serpula lacrymans var. lacrymans S7.9]